MAKNGLLPFIGDDAPFWAIPALAAGITLLLPTLAGFAGRAIRALSGGFSLPFQRGEREIPDESGINLLFREAGRVIAGVWLFIVGLLYVLPLNVLAVTTLLGPISAWAWRNQPFMAGLTIALIIGVILIGGGSIATTRRIQKWLIAGLAASILLGFAWENITKSIRFELRIDKNGIVRTIPFDAPFLKKGDVLLIYARGAYKTKFSLLRKGGKIIPKVDRIYLPTNPLGNPEEVGDWAGLGEDRPRGELHLRIGNSTYVVRGARPGGWDYEARFVVPADGRLGFVINDNLTGKYGVYLVKVRVNPWSAGIEKFLYDLAHSWVGIWVGTLLWIVISLAIPAWLVGASRLGSFCASYPRLARWSMSFALLAPLMFAHGIDLPAKVNTAKKVAAHATSRAYEKYVPDSVKQEAYDLLHITEKDTLDEVIATSFGGKSILPLMKKGRVPYDFPMNGKVKLLFQGSVRPEKVFLAFVKFPHQRVELRQPEEFSSQLAFEGKFWIELSFAPNTKGANVAFRLVVEKQ